MYRDQNQTLKKYNQSLINKKYNRLKINWIAIYNFLKFAKKHRKFNVLT